MGKPKFSFWETKPADQAGMTLNWNNEEIHEMERVEICSYLPPLEGKRVLELGSGIGRYTKQFTRTAGLITAVDFIKKFLFSNRRCTGSCTNISYVCAAAQKLHFKPKSFDFIFTNWLFMYLTDQEAQELIQTISCWLNDRGTFFIRESCKVPSTNDHPEFQEFTHYRDPKFYRNILRKYFSIQHTGNVVVYQKCYNNPYQLFWLCEKRD